MRVGGDSKSAGQVYDIFIRADDVSLKKKTYPALMRVKDFLNYIFRAKKNYESRSQLCHAPRTNGFTSTPKDAAQDAPTHWV